MDFERTPNCMIHQSQMYHIYMKKSIFPCADPTWWCSVCELPFDYKSKFERHKRSAKHNLLLSTLSSKLDDSFDDEDMESDVEKDICIEEAEDTCIVVQVSLLNI